MLDIIRALVKEKRDRVAQDTEQSNRTKEFTWGLIYNVLHWTPGVASDDQRDALKAALRIALQPEVSEQDFMRVRDILSEVGFYLTPQPE